MKKFQLFSVFAAVTALSGAALAGGHGGPRGGGMFKHLDKNADGKVTLAEAQAGAQERFTGMDKNKDGTVTQAEVEGRGHRLFKKADANNDGKITLAEVQTQSAQFFSRFDSNNDKVITQEEVKAARGDRPCHKS
jgi:Ca2+-binding EF-hand superfamily protein